MGSLESFSTKKCGVLSQNGDLGAVLRGFSYRIEGRSLLRR